jgi:hypothetical protein
MVIGLNKLRSISIGVILICLAIILILTVGFYIVINFIEPFKTCEKQDYIGNITLGKQIIDCQILRNITLV